MIGIKLPASNVESIFPMTNSFLSPIYKENRILNRDCHALSPIAVRIAIYVKQALGVPVKLGVWNVVGGSMAHQSVKLASIYHAYMCRYTASLSLSIFLPG